MNLQWKGRQLKCPNGSDPNLYSQVKIHFLLLGFIDRKLLELYSIIFMLELVISLITLILKCAGMDQSSTVQ